MKSMFNFKEQHAAITFYMLFAAWIFFNIFWCFYETQNSASKDSEHQSYYNDHSQDGAKLEKLVKRASMGDNRVIVTILDRKCASNDSLFEIFLEGFKVGYSIKQLLNHLVVFTEDDPTYEYCKSLHTHCFDIATYRTNSTWESFKSHNQIRLGWRIVDLLGEIIDLGYSVLFTEVDVLWLRNPFLHFKVTTEITTALENTHSNVSDLGFFNLISNERTFQFLKYWRMNSVLYPNTTHKSVFEIIKKDSQTEMIGLRIDYLDTHVFNSLCEPASNMSMICTLHAKCYGSSERIFNLRQIVDFMKNSSVSHQAKMA